MQILSRSKKLFGFGLPSLFIIVLLYKIMANVSLINCTLVRLPGWYARPFQQSHVATCDQSPVCSDVRSNLNKINVIQRQCSKLTLLGVIPCFALRAQIPTPPFFLNNGGGECCIVPHSSRYGALTKRIYYPYGAFCVGLQGHILTHLHNPAGQIKL